MRTAIFFGLLVIGDSIVRCGNAMTDGGVKILDESATNINPVTICIEAVFAEEGIVIPPTTASIIPTLSNHNIKIPKSSISR